MADEKPPEILGSLPRTRPHRRSDKRSERAEGGSTTDASDRPNAETPAPDRPNAETPAPDRPNARAPAPARSKARATGPGRSKTRRQAPQRRPRPEPLRQPEQPLGTPPAPRRRRPIPASGTELLSTVVKTTAELAEIGLSVSARAVRSAIGRLPKP